MSLPTYDLLTFEEEVALSVRMHTGLKGDREAALRTILSSNIGLVCSMVEKYPIPPHYDFDDLYQEGMLGVIRAAEKFDPGVGCRFSTYASWWIRDFISKFLNKNHFGAPHASLGKMKDLKKAEAEGHELTEDQDALNVALRSRNFDLVVQHIEDIDSHEIDNDISGVLEKVLTPTEYQIVSGRIGHGREAPETYAQMSERLGMAPHVLRLTYNEGLEKLRELLASDESIRYALGVS